MRVALTFGVLLPLLACGGSIARAADDTPYEIHVIEAMSGGGSFVGKGEAQSLAIFEKLVNAQGGINGRPLHFVYHDDQSAPQIAVQLANDILALHPAVVFGATLVASCGAVMPLMQAAGPVFYCAAPGVHPAAGSYAYSAGVSTIDLTTAAIRYFRLRGWKRIAIMTSTDASGQDAERSLLQVAALPENSEVTIVAKAHFNTSDVSVSAQIEDIKAAKPQLLFAWSTGAPIATVFRGIQQAGLDIPVATTDGNMNYAAMTQFAAFLPKELYIQAGPWVVNGDPAIKLDPAVVAKQKEFYAAFQAAGLEPDAPSQSGWEPAAIVIDALRKIGTQATSAQLNDYLQHVKGYASIDGIYDFARTPQRGLDIDNALVTRWNPTAKHWQAVSQLTGSPLP